MARHPLFFSHGRLVYVMLCYIDHSNRLTYLFFFFLCFWCSVLSLGMLEMLKPTSLIMGAGLGMDVACLTDGRFSGG